MFLNTVYVCYIQQKIDNIFCTKKQYNHFTFSGLFTYFIVFNHIW